MRFIKPRRTNASLRSIDVDQKSFREERDWWEKESVDLILPRDTALASKSDAEAKMQEAEKGLAEVQGRLEEIRS